MLSDNRHFVLQNVARDCILGIVGLSPANELYHSIGVAHVVNEV